MSVVYKHGLKLPKVRCHRCGGDRAAVVKREGAAWRLHLNCGHVKTAGWTKPPEQLRKEGLVLTESPVDPRIAIDKRLKEEDKSTEAGERYEHLLREQNFTNSKYF